MKTPITYLTLFFVLFFISFSFAQETIKREVLEKAEKMPSFPGGDQKMMNYLASTLKYPADAAANKWSGTVFISFVVNEDGKISDILPLKEVDGDYEHSLTKEAIRVILSMPAWKPGTEKGKAVAVKYTLPVKFELK